MLRRPPAPRGSWWDKRRSTNLPRLPAPVHDGSLHGPGRRPRSKRLRLRPRRDFLKAFMGAGGEQMHGDDGPGAPRYFPGHGFRNPGSRLQADVRRKPVWRPDRVCPTPCRKGKAGRITSSPGPHSRRPGMRCSAGRAARHRHASAPRPLIGRIPFEGGKPGPPIKALWR